MKTVTELAREAGPLISTPFDKWCENFHDLAIAQYRESLLAGVGEPDYTDSALYEPTAYTRDKVAAAVAIERERCAKLCDIETSVNVTNANEAYQEGRAMGAAVCAAAIRGQR